MDLPRVNTCCFGLLPLKIGALICGVISLVVELGNHGMTAWYSHDSTLRMIFQILVVCGVIGAILLIIGVLMERPWFAQLYIVAYILLVILSIVLLIWVVVTKKGISNDRLISDIVYICVVGYCLIVVNSYRYTMG